MAKRRHKNSRRDVIRIANPPIIHNTYPYSLPRKQYLLPSLSRIQDDRYHHPVRVKSLRGYRTLTGSVTISRPNVRKSYDRSFRIYNTLSPDTLVCVRRAQRREVLFALGRGGRSGRQNKHRPKSRLNCYRRRR